MDIIQELKLAIVEYISTIAGLLSVWFTIKRNIWCWPVGILWAATSIYIFHEYKLYSDMILGAIYVLLLLYGWHAWLHGGEDHGVLRVGVLTPQMRFFAIFIGTIGTALWGLTMAMKTDASVPFWDATTTVFSLVAQFLMGRKLIEHWYFWIFVDTLAIGIYIYKEMIPYSLLYAVFLILAFRGMYEWHHALRNKGAA